MKRKKYQLGNTARVKEYFSDHVFTCIPDISESLKIDEYKVSRIVAYLKMRGFINSVKKIKREDRKDPFWIYKWTWEDKKGDR